MTCAVHASWDFANLGLFSATFSDTAGVYAVTMSDGTYAHQTFASVTNATGRDVTGITDLATALKTDLDANLDGTFTVAFSTTTLKYTITSTINLKISAANTVALNMTGFSDGQLPTSGSVKTYTGANASYYSRIVAAGARCNYKGLREKRTIGEDAEADDGTPGGSVLTTPPQYADFEFQSEVAADTRIRDLVATDPWTWEAFVKYVRNQIPFLIVDTETEAHQLRAEGMSWEEIPFLDPNVHTLFVIPMLTRFLGRV